MKNKITLATAVSLALAVGLAACTQYAYVPTTNATVERGRIAAEYPIPADSPHGDLRLASFGLAEIGPRKREERGEHIRALHLRFTITNNGDRDWTFDTRQQLVQLEGFGTSVPAFATASEGSPLPIVHVPAMQKRVVDLFFPLPVSLQKARNLPSFDVVWRLQAYDRFVSRRTPFERVIVEPPPGYYSPYDYGNYYWWGPPYWYNPGYAESGFVGGVRVPERYYAGSVEIHGDTGAPAHFMARSGEGGAPGQPRAGQ